MFYCKRFRVFEKVVAAQNDILNSCTLNDITSVLFKRSKGIKLAPHCQLQNPEQD